MLSKSLKRPDIVLFDMDGTTVRHINPALISTLEFCDDMLFKLGKLFKRNHDITDVSQKPAGIRGLLVHRILHKIRRKSVDQIVQPCPGIFLILDLLRRNNIPMGIVSNGLGQGYGHDILNTFKLSDYFTVKLFREDMQKSKPHPDSLLRAIQNIGQEITAQTVIWYIGDRHKDMDAAIAANNHIDATVVPIAYSIHAAIAALKYQLPHEQIVMHYPDFYVRMSKEIFNKE